MNYLNSVRVNVATVGTGAVTPGTAYSSDSLTMAEAGAVNGAPYTYVLREGNDREVGWGVWNGTTLTRNVRVSKIGGAVSTTAKMNLAGNAVLVIDAAAEDLNGLLSSDVQSLTTAAQTQMLTNLGAAPLIVLKTANYSLTAADRGKLMSCSIALGSTLTLAGLSAATAGVGFGFIIENTGYGQVVFDPAGSETVDGALTINAYKGQPAFWIVSDGANWKTIGRQKTFAISTARSVSGAAALDFTFPDNLPNTELLLAGVYGSVASQLLLRTSQDGTTFDSGSTDYGYGITNHTASAPAAGSAAASFIPVSDAVYNSVFGAGGSIKMVRPAGTLFTMTGLISHYNANIGGFEVVAAGGYRSGGTAIKAVRLIFASGNLSADTVILMGVAP